MNRKISALILLLLFSLTAYPQTIHLWKGTSVKASGVTLVPFLPESASDVPAVIVCPGGSYFWLDRTNEGTMVCEWLRSNGIAAFLLEYRTGGWFEYTFATRAVFRGHQHPDMIEDIQRAVQTVRENHELYGVDPSKIGCMGFSAGGHLVMSSAEYFGTDFLKPHGIDSSVSLRPDFVAPIYPVVSMSADCTHHRSRRGLLGERRVRSLEMRDSLSLEKHVRQDTPPVFLLNCVDDPVVDFHNSELLDSALAAAGVPHQYIQFQTGGHGFGANPDRFTEETAGWQELFMQWIRRLFQ